MTEAYTQYEIYFKNEGPFYSIVLTRVPDSLQLCPHDDGFDTALVEDGERFTLPSLGI